MREMLEPSMVGKHSRDVQCPRHPQPERTQPERVVQVNDIRREVANSLPGLPVKRVREADHCPKSQDRRNTHDARFGAIRFVGGTDEQHLVPLRFEPAFEPVDGYRYPAREGKIGVGEHGDPHRATERCQIGCVIVRVVVAIPEQPVVEIGAEEDQPREDQKEVPDTDIE